MYSSTGFASKKSLEFIQRLIFQERKSIVKKEHSLVDRYRTNTHKKFLQYWQDDNRRLFCLVFLGGAQCFFKICVPPFSAVTNVLLGAK